MKNLVKLFVVIALSAISLSVSAQAGSNGENAVDVNNNSTRKFTVDLHTGSTYAWSVSEGPSDGFSLSNTQNVATITWSKVGLYKVSVVETNELGCSSDDNIKEFWINVKANDFSVVPSWDSKANGSTNACAISGDNSVSFTLTKTGGKADAAWNYKYSVTKKYSDGTSTVIADNVEGTVASALTTTIDITSGILPGENDCTFTFQLISATDFYKAPNSNPTAANSVDAVVHQVPATSNITID